VLWTAIALSAPLLLDFGPDDRPPLDGTVRVGTDVHDVDVLVVRGTPWAVEGFDPAIATGVTDAQLVVAVERGKWLVAVLQPPAPEDHPSANPRGGYGIRIDQLDIIHRDSARTFAGYLGSKRYAANPIPDYRVQTSPFERMIGSQATWDRFPMTVQEGGMMVETFGRPISAMVLARSLEELESGVAEVDEARRRAAEDKMHYAGLPPVPDGPVLGVPGQLPNEAEANEHRVLFQGQREELIWWLPAGAWHIRTRDLPRPEEVLWWDRPKNAREIATLPTWVRPIHGTTTDQGLPVGVVLTVAAGRPGTRTLRVEARGPSTETLTLEVTTLAREAPPTEWSAAISHGTHAMRTLHQSHHEAEHEAFAGIDALTDAGISAIKIESLSPASQAHHAAMFQHWEDAGGRTVLWDWQDNEYGVVQTGRSATFVSPALSQTWAEPLPTFVEARTPAALRQAKDADLVLVAPELRSGRKRDPRAWPTTDSDRPFAALQAWSEGATGAMVGHTQNGAATLMNVHSLATSLVTMGPEGGLWRSVDLLTLRREMDVIGLLDAEAPAGCAAQHAAMVDRSRSEPPSSGSALESLRSELSILWAEGCP